uniref:BPTI/Kunitz inhibitor domain-containing protein n=1 Tax=Sinocyclocheilus grahami TaxID=75366 RepID=A0A672R784_SINGR
MVFLCFSRVINLHTAPLKEWLIKSKINFSKCLSLFVPGPCAAPSVVGPCKGVFSRWYYDSKTGDCQHLQYGGCKGNHNNFLQKSDCINECIQKPSETFEYINDIAVIQLRTLLKALISWFRCV